MEAKSVPLPSEPASLLVSQFKQFYAEFAAENIARLDEIYTQDVEFRDPVHAIHGSLGLKHYLRGMAGGLRHYRIRYLDEQVGDHAAWFSWEMDFAHRRLRGGRIITVRGMTQIRYTSRVYYHEDCYDMGALLYEHLPGIGTATRFLKRRLARRD